jgi:hypothetical protein
MVDTFSFCPNSLVPVTMPREPVQVVSFNGWQFTAKPTTPYQRRFKVTLHGMKWFLNSATGVYDSTTTPTINARALELFYQAHEGWDPFLWQHPHIATPLTVRFGAPVVVPEALPNSGGRCAPLEINLIEHNAGYT